jgi:hypothetical protein
MLIPFLGEHLHHSSTIKRHKEVTKQLIEGSGSGQMNYWPDSVHTDPTDPDPARNTDFRNSCLSQIKSTYVHEMKVPQICNSGKKESRKFP